MADDRKPTKSAKPADKSPKGTKGDNGTVPSEPVKAAAPTPDAEDTAPAQPAKAPATDTLAEDDAHETAIAGASAPAPADTPDVRDSSDDADGDVGEDADDAEPDDAGPDDAGPDDAAPDDRPRAEDKPPVSAVPVPQPAPVIERRGGFWPMVLGGVVAAGLGYGAAWYQFGPMAQDEARQSLAALRVDLGAQSGRVEQLADRIDALPGGQDLSGLEAAGADLRAQVSALAGQIEALQPRLKALENRPVVTGGSVSDADLAALSQRIEAQATQIAAIMDAATAREAEANATAQATLRRAALTRIQTALDSGSGFSAALADLEATGQEIPADLRSIADDGVPTMAQLRDAFPPAARAALAASRESAGDDTGAGGFWAFMSDQLGARSLEPREGSDADAVLSRAEAALRDGRLADALAEIDTLPPHAAGEMSGWAAEAQERLNALGAAESLATQLN